MSTKQIGTMTLLRAKQVLAKTGQKRTALYNAIKEGSFPAPVKISTRCVAWVDAEVDAWIESKISSSKKSLNDVSRHED